MVNAEHAPAMASPVRTDEQIVPRNRWVPIRKSNCYLNEEKSQPSPIFKIDIKESVKEVVISSVKHAMRAPLHARFKDLPTFDIKEILLQRMLEENYDKGHANHRVVYEALQDSIRHDESDDFDVDKAQEETKKKRWSVTSTAAPSSSKTAASVEYSAWTTTDTWIKPLITTIPDDLYMDDETTTDEQAVSSGDEALHSKSSKVLFILDVIHLLIPNGKVHTLLTDQVDDTILRFITSVGRPALLISKMKAAYYPDVGLEQLVPDQFWIEEECKMTSCYDQKLVIRQRVEDLPTDSPRAVIFRDKYGVQMIMRFNEIHKFNDGTLQQIDEALDYQVKEFRINMTNPGMNARFWTKKDVDRSKDFMFAIQK
ncbi:hypothetical protein Tco_0527871 [Tanacetum coccineum]